jgi:nitroreductase
MTVSDQQTARDAILSAIDRRRAVRSFTGDPVSSETLQQVLHAARRAPSGSNRRIHKFLVVRDPATIRLIKTFSPGIAGPAPPAIIVICTDHEVARAFSVQEDRDTTTWIDVGTSAMNMMIAASALGLGTCPVTSFSTGAVAEILELPEHVSPELMLITGYPAEDQRRGRARAPRARKLDDLVHWERFGHTAPE